MLQIRDSQAVAAAITMMSVSWIPENTTYHSSQSRHCGEGYVRLRSRCDSHLPTLMVTVLSSNRLFVISLVVFLACHASLAWTICVSNNNTAKFPELENRSKIHLMQHMSYPYVLYSLTFFIRRLLLPSISLQVETRLRHLIATKCIVKSLIDPRRKETR